MKTRCRRSDGGGITSMAAMIDVVFLLLVFFLVTVKARDVEAHLDVARQRPGGEARIETVRIDVYSGQYVMQGKRVDLEEMDRVLAKLSGISKSMSVVVTCSGDSSHSELVKVLDLCAKSELSNLSLMSR